MEDLTVSDCELILDSLHFTIRAFEQYQYYPSYEFKTKRIAEAKNVRAKMIAIKKAVKEKAWTP